MLQLTACCFQMCGGMSGRGTAGLSQGWLRTALAAGGTAETLHKQYSDLFTQPALITNLVFLNEYFKRRELHRLLE